MIRKMLAMLVAISCAFGAWADATHISGTDFSTHPTGDFITGRDDYGAATESTYWYNGNTNNDFSGTIVLGTNGTDRILDFESSITNPLYRTIIGCYGEQSPAGFTPTNINSVLFVDTFVAFTPYLVNENHPAPTRLTNEDKIIVWVRETDSGDEETANATNLIVTAGYLDVNGDPTQTNYVVNLTRSGQTVSDLCNGLHRLTIKAFKSITTVNDSTVGFVIYVDEYPVECVGDVFADNCAFAGDYLVATPKKYADLDQLFPSMMPYNASTPANQLSAVGYAGVGQIGEVWYDDKNTAPKFARDDVQDFTVTFGDDVKSFIYRDVTYTSPTNLTADSLATSVIISNVIYAAGWKHKDGNWRNGSVVVSNQVGTVGDYGTFNFADGTAFTLAGFKANYIVGDKEYQNLLGPDGALAAAIAAGASLKLNSDVVINESYGDNDGYILVDEFQTLVIDLNGHTIQGTSENAATIVNNGGTLTIIDTSANHDGKVLGCWVVDGESGEYYDNEWAIAIYEEAVSTELNAGIFETVTTNESHNAIVLNGGTYYAINYDDPGAQPAAFYLAEFIASGKTVTAWTQDPDTDQWYATVGIASGIIYPVTFSTNTVEVAEYTTNIAACATLPVDAIPAFTGGAWDLDPTNAVINAATNFNYTIAASYTLTYASDHGAIPDGETYTASTPDFALAAAPTADGWSFGGWLIGSDVFEAGATYVVADHLENTTATAVWTPVTYTLTYTTEHGDAPAAVSYTVESNNFALAAAPVTSDVGVEFAGWVIGAVTNNAGATYVVADHLANTTATAAWTAIVAPPKFPQSDTAGTEYAGRDGTAAKPFVIRNYDDLVVLKNAIADGEFTTASFEVVSNITGVTDWVGIGTSSSVAFAGTLNGNGKTINVTFAGGTYNGLFAFVNNATLSNLTVNVTAAASFSGEAGGAAIIGKAYGSCTFETLMATGSLGSSSVPLNHNAAGICASVCGSDCVVNFNSCTNAMDIYANYKKVGGILAGRDPYVTAEVNFNNCVNTGDIYNGYGQKVGGYGVGGLMGWTGYANPSGITIASCSNTGDIVAPNMYVGSYIGDVSAAPDASGVNTCLASLAPSGSDKINGLNWATVDGDLATFVTPVTLVGTTVSYKLMQAEGATTGFTLTAADASLTIDSSLVTYTGTVSVDSTLSADYDLRETAIATGTIYSLVSKTPADPWAPAAETDEAASNKVVAIFGEDVATKINTYDDYTNLVAYIKYATDNPSVGTNDLTTAQKEQIYPSWKLWAADLFTDAPVISIVSVTTTATAGQWAFNVQVTQGDSSTVLEVAAAKVAALVKVRNSLTTGDWAPPASVNAVELGDYTIQVTVSYGDATSGFMKISD